MSTIINKETPKFSYGKLGTISLGKTLGFYDIILDKYAADGSLAVILQSTNPADGYIKLSICVQGTPLNAREFVLKTYSENAQIVPYIQDCGFFAPTGRQINMPFGKFAPIWKVL